ncbi:MAG: peptidase M61 [Candidatus Sedimenticola sp. (ex Thyasira tokunagai)]
MMYYKVRPSSPKAHLFSVELRVTQPAPEGVTLFLPAWIPGSYMIRDFAKNIVTLTASCEGHEVPVEKRDKQSWQCAPCRGDLVISYTVYAWDLSVRSAHLDTTHGYFNGTSLFLSVAGRTAQHCSVEILPPEGDAYSDWRVATTLATAAEREPLSFGKFSAANYNELIDHPVEMGLFTHASFDVRGVTHEIAITGRHSADIERLCRDLKPICETHIDLFGELPVMERYLFQVMAVGDGYGGLEHNSSTSLICKRDDLPLRGVSEVTDGYRQFLGLCSHEYFHLWNVKRIRPRVFQQADLSKEVYTRLLWLFEGVTSYYDDLALLRSGRIDSDSYMELLAQVITRVIRGNGRRKQTVSESSFDAWTKFYKQDENAPNAIVSYYSKGSLVALALDLTIRRESDGRHSLDDVMRALWLRHGVTDIGIGEDEVEAVIKDVTGVDCAGLLSLALDTTEDLPLEELFESVGIGFRLRAARNPQDNGGVKKEAGKKEMPLRVPGARYRTHPLGVELAQVFDDGAAQSAGLSAGDVILAVDGIRSTEKSFAKQMGAAEESDIRVIHAFRRDELMTFNLSPQSPPIDTCDLWLEKGAGSQQINCRFDWLRVSTTDV